MMTVSKYLHVASYLFIKTHGSGHYKLCVILLILLIVLKVEFASSYYNVSEDDGVLTVELLSSTASDFTFRVQINASKLEILNGM